MSLKFYKIQNLLEKWQIIGKLCSCDMCCNKRRTHDAAKHKLSKRELLSLEELTNWQYSYA